MDKKYDTQYLGENITLHYSWFSITRGERVEHIYLKLREVIHVQVWIFAATIPDRKALSILRSRVSDPNPHCFVFGSWIRIRIRGKSGSESALNSKFRSFRGIEWSLGGPWKLKMEAWRLKNMEAWRVKGPVFADSGCICRIRIRIEKKKWIQIRIRIEKKSCIRKKICEHLITNNMHVLTYI